MTTTIFFHVVDLLCFLPMCSTSVNVPTLYLILCPSNSRNLFYSSFCYNPLNQSIANSWKLCLLFPKSIDPYQLCCHQLTSSHSIKSVAIFFIFWLQPRLILSCLVHLPIMAHEVLWGGTGRGLILAPHPMSHSHTWQTHWMFKSLVQNNIRFLYRLHTFFFIFNSSLIFYSRYLIQYKSYITSSNALFTE